MRQKVIGFDTDEQEHWRAQLACGHAIHVRHDPPWTLRPWVLDPSERARRIGSEMDCTRCEEHATDRG